MRPMQTRNQLNEPISRHENAVRRNRDVDIIDAPALCRSPAVCPGPALGRRIPPQPLPDPQAMNLVWSLRHQCRNERQSTEQPHLSKPFKVEVELHIGTGCNGRDLSICGGFVGSALKQGLVAMLPAKLRLSSVLPAVSSKGNLRDCEGGR